MSVDTRRYDLQPQTNVKAITIHENMTIRIGYLGNSMLCLSARSTISYGYDAEPMLHVQINYHSRLGKFHRLNNE